MNKAASILCGLLVSAWAVSARPAATGSADEPAGVPRVGGLHFSTADYVGMGLQDGLRELGYVNGENIVFDWRTTQGTDEALRSAAADLAHSKVDLIVATSTPAARAALAVTRAPVVILTGDPIAAGFAVSLAHPGGRATGVSLVTTDLAAKRVELLCSLIPRPGRIAFLLNSANPASGWQLKEAQEASRTLGVQLVPLDMQALGGVEATLSELRRRRADGVVVAAESAFMENRAKIARAVREARLPAIFPASQYHDSRILMSYGPDLRETWRRLARYVAKILKGAVPGDLPIDQVSQFELVVNLNAARELGIEVPESLLLRANRVIR